MRSGPKICVLLLMALLPLFLADAGIAAASRPSAEPGADVAPQAVRVTVRRGEVRDGSRSILNSVEAVLVDGHAPSRVTAGWQVPIATGGGETGGEISYQNVGLSLRLRARVLGGGRVELSGNVEDSSLDDRLSTLPRSASPTLRTYRQDVDAVLVEGEPLRVGSVVDASGTASFLEIEVDVLD